MLAEAKKDNPNFRSIDPITGEKIVAATPLTGRIEPERVTTTPLQRTQSMGMSL
jgi:hypothetical protein